MNNNEKPAPRRCLLDMGIARFAGPAPIQEWAVSSPKEGGGLLPAKEPMLLVGRGGIGKTRAAVELALKIAAPRKGKDLVWMGQPIIAQGVSIVLTYEESTDRMHRAIQNIAEAAGVSPQEVGDRMIVKSFQDPDIVPMPLVSNNPKTRMPSATPEYLAITAELRVIRERLGEIGCIVVDNAGTALAVEGNDYQSSNQAMKWLQRWSSEFGALVILIAHTNKGALKFESDDPSDDELEAAAMGSTGWVSAVRLAMVMWSISEEGEARIAKSLGDGEFKPGITRRRYIKARTVKSNVDGAYTGCITLRRAGGTLEDVTRETKSALDENMNTEIADFAAAVGRCWTLHTPVQKSGTNGVYEQRSALGGRFAKMSKSALAALTGRAVASGALRLEAVAPGVEGGRGKWLFDCSGRGRREMHLKLFWKAKRVADRARVPFKLGAIGEWRRFLEPCMAGMSDEGLAAAINELEEARHLAVKDGYLILSNAA
jgi:hypothetical protein